MGREMGECEADQCRLGEVGIRGQSYSLDRRLTESGRRPRANCVFLRPCWFEVLIQDVWIDVGTVGPGDGAGSRLNLHLAKSSQIGPDRVKDRALDISPD